MSSPWFAVEECDSASDDSHSFFGIFNRSPTDIASIIPRPKTPFVVSRDPIQSKIADHQSPYGNAIESPHINRKGFIGQLVSVF